MGDTIVSSTEYDIFECQPALMRCLLPLALYRSVAAWEMPPKQFHYFAYRHATLCRHQSCTLFMQRRMQTYCHMAVALVKEAFEFTFHTDTAHRDALRAPRHAIIGFQQFRSLQHIIKIVHRLALPHENDIRQPVCLWQRIHLVHYVAHGEVALPSLLTCLTEQTVHLASYLTADTQRSTVLIGDEHRLNLLS